MHLHSLSCDQSSIIIDCGGNAPRILFFGSKLDDATSPETAAALLQREEAPARPAIEAPVSMSPETGAGFMGSPGIRAHRDGQQWSVYSHIVDVDANTDGELSITSFCDATHIRIVHRLALDPHSCVLTMSTEIVNAGDTDLCVDFCAAATIPLPLNYSRILGFCGRWANEFKTQSVERFVGAYVRENRTGRTSHDAFPGVIIHTPDANETQGAALAMHLGWSGNSRLSVEELSDGRAYAQAGELFYPGEIMLAPDERYRSPDVFVAHGDSGLSKLSQCFHRHVRQHLTARRVAAKPRPVHFNTWEAVYFEQSTEKLQAMAAAAAGVGVERFVLDDGWFRNRNSDKAGLGDWFVDEQKFPNGLSPLIEFVCSTGMEFGLWLEPEMVNEDSDLFRAHPDWVLSAPGAPLQEARNQLVLDLTRKEVVDYLFERIDALLSEYPISYLKWDMNRDISQPGGQHGRAVGHAQVLSVYALLQRVREAHPDVEIESCSSGGGRSDYGVLRHTDRIWTSDSNDALDRMRIQKGFSHFFPAHVMGAHVGAARCHVTGRRLDLAMRAGVALFGHMGIEADLLELADDETQELKAAVDLHKRHRQLIHNGNLFRLNLPEYEHGFGIVAEDKLEALFLYAVVATPPRSLPCRFRFEGLACREHYTVSVVWPRSGSSRLSPVLYDLQSRSLTGDALMNVGVQLPIMRPESLLIFHITAVLASCQKRSD